MWKWNLIIIGIVAIGIFIIMYIMLDLTALEDRAGHSPAVSSGATPQDDQVNVVNWDDLLEQSATLPLEIKGQLFRASVAVTPEERQQGLSLTSSLGADIAKLFVFDSDDYWGIWMKDMQYAIDIVWLDSQKTVVHIERGVSPDTYPTVFLPQEPARYVIELQSGVVERLRLQNGDEVYFY